jgi:hypothetical protein
MRRLLLRTGAAFVLGLGMMAVSPARPLTAQDTKPDTKSPDTKPTTETPTAKPTKPTFPGYVFVTEAMGEVVTADENSVKLRITWYTQQQAKNAKGQPLTGNAGNYSNPFAPNRNHPKQQQPQMRVVEQHKDYVLEYLPQSLVRLHQLPPKKDDKGLKVEYTQKELETEKVPGVVGFRAERSDVVPGTYLEVFLIRDKTIPEAKATDGDLRIKYAVIWGKDPNPPKDTGTPPSKKN